MNKTIFSICRQLNEHKYFEAVVDPDLITWTDVADYFLPRTQQHVELVRDRKIDIPKTGRFQDHDFIVQEIATGATFCLSKFWNLNYKTQSLWDTFVDEHPGVGVDFHLFGGLTATAQSFPPHNDLAANYIIQLDGQCEWTIYNERATYQEALNYVVYPESKLTVKTQQILSPGDVLFIPSGIHHHCRPLGKRLSLSIPIL
jgi:ribosomal protein L16 Arg81 hydroxylase